MPGPVSDSYDPEWGTSSVASDIDDALSQVYAQLTYILGRKSPMDIRDLVSANLPTRVQAVLSEREWRLLRFAVERARESL